MSQPDPVIERIVSCDFAPRGGHIVTHVLGTRAIRWGCPVANTRAHKTAKGLGGTTCHSEWRELLLREKQHRALTNAFETSQAAGTDDLVWFHVAHAALRLRLVMKRVVEDIAVRTASSFACHWSVHPGTGTSSCYLHVICTAPDATRKPSAEFRINVFAMSTRRISASGCALLPVERLVQEHFEQFVRPVLAACLETYSEAVLTLVADGFLSVAP